VCIGRTRCRMPVSSRWGKTMLAGGGSGAPARAASGSSRGRKRARLHDQGREPTGGLPDWRESEANSLATPTVHEPQAKPRGMPCTRVVGTAVSRRRADSASRPGATTTPHLSASGPARATEGGIRGRRGRWLMSGYEAARSQIGMPLKGTGSDARPPCKLCSHGSAEDERPTRRGAGHRHRGVTRDHPASRGAHGVAQRQ